MPVCPPPPPSALSLFSRRSPPYTTSRATLSDLDAGHVAKFCFDSLLRRIACSGALPSAAAVSQWRTKGASIPCAL